MNIFAGRLSGLVVLTGLLGACASQAAVQAEFHLPVAAHWGNTVLMPGDYKIQVMDLVSGVKQVAVQGTGKPIWRLPAAMDAQSTEGPSSLKLVQVDGDYFVREYRSSLAGKTFTFGVPKHAAAHAPKDIELGTK